jgi:hypothetical protein
MDYEMLGTAIRETPTRQKLDNSLQRPTDTYHIEQYDFLKERTTL